MFHGSHLARSRSYPDSAFRFGVAWLLCALMLVFCANAKLASFGFGDRHLKHATTQSFLASEEARLEAAIAALLMMGCVAILRVPRFLSTSQIAPMVPAATAPKTEVIDRESHLRPPPAI